MGVAMTKDEIIRMAREAGIGALTDYGKEALKHFAALVAAHEREKCAKVCENLYKHLNYDVDCQKLWPHTKMINDQYAAAIRARTT